MIKPSELKSLCKNTEKSLSSESVVLLMEDEIMNKVFSEIARNALNNPHKSQRWCILKTHTYLNGDNL